MQSHNASNFNSILHNFASETFQKDKKSSIQHLFLSFVFYLHLIYIFIPLLSIYSAPLFKSLSLVHIHIKTKKIKKKGRQFLIRHSSWYILFFIIYFISCVLHQIYVITFLTDCCYILIGGIISLSLYIYIYIYMCVCVCVCVCVLLPLNMNTDIWIKSPFF